MRLLSLLVIGMALLSFKKSDVGDEKWIPLFDGKTTQGWHSYGNKTAGDAWNVQDGALHLKAAEKSSYQTRGGGDLVTDKEFENFEMKLEWKISKDGNSGIIFYVQDDKAKFGETWQTGIETQVLDIKGNEDANIPMHQVSDLYDLIACSSHPAKPFGEWNSVRMKSLNGKLDIFLNETQVISTTLWDDHWKELIKNSKFKNMPGFGMFRKGHLALQDHGAEVWYRNIYVRILV